MQSLIFVAVYFIVGWIVASLVPSIAGNLPRRPARPALREPPTNNGTRQRRATPNMLGALSPNEARQLTQTERSRCP